MENKKKVAVIGAGPCGILMAYHLKQQAKSIEFDVFEKQGAPGGQWVFRQELKDQFGQDVHSSVYNNLWINAPKETLELPMYPFPKGTPSFFPHKGMTEYLLGFVKKFSLDQHIHLHSLVELVQYKESSGTFMLTKLNLKTYERETIEYDHVVVANGHFAVPNDVSFQGEESFTGKLLHAHHFRNEIEYKGKDVLVVGGAYSAEDIAVNLYKFGASHVTIAMRGSKMDFIFPEGVEQKPNVEVKLIEGRAVQFSDGSMREYDAIIKCTGYQHSFPFLEESIRPKLTNVLNPPLYQQIISPVCPALFFMGMQDQLYTILMFNAQANYIRAVIAKELKIPESLEERLAWIQDDKNRAKGLEGKLAKVNYQGQYVSELCKLVGDTPYRIDHFIMEQKQYKIENILTYRNLTYKSIFTGYESTEPAIPWLSNGEGTEF